MSENELPDGWKWKRLNDVVENPKDDIVSGPFGSNLVVADYQEKGIPIIRLQNIQRGKFLKVDIKYVSPEKAEELKRHSYLPGDILVAKLGVPIGKSCVVPDYFEAGIIVADVVRVRINRKENNVRFIEYVLNSPIVTYQLNSNIIGSTRPRVNLDDVRDLWIPIPNLDEQEKIVSKLDRQMAQIEIMKKEAENQEEAFSSLFFSYISEKFDNKYPIEKLGSLVNEIKNGVYKSPSFRGKGHKLVRMYNIENDSIQLNDNSLELIELTNDELENYALRNGDVLISRVNSAELVGKCGVIKDKLVGYAYENMVMRVRVNSLKLLPDYLAYFLISPRGKNEIRFRAKHAINQSSINNKDVGSISVPLPPTLDVQKEIVKDLNSKFEYIEGLKDQIKIQLIAIECLKSSILNEIFGKYEIPDEA